MFAGFNKKLAVFDLTRPGHGCREVTTKKKREDGLPGALPAPVSLRQLQQPCSFCSATIGSCLPCT